MLPKVGYKISLVKKNSFHLSMTFTMIKFNTHEKNLSQKCDSSNKNQTSQISTHECEHEEPWKEATTLNGS